MLDSEHTISMLQYSYRKLLAKKSFSISLNNFAPNVLLGKVVCAFMSHMSIFNVKLAESVFSTPLPTQ